MKNATILHGTGSTPESFWHPYLKRELEERGYKVWVPALSGGDDPVLEICLQLVLDNCEFDSETVLIGHSSGCPLALSVLQRIPSAVYQTVLVAGYSRPKGAAKEPEAILQPEYDWDTIRSHAGKVVLFNSDNDPWGCDETEGRYLFDRLGGISVILHGEGHMGSEAYGQEYREFPLLLKIIEYGELTHSAN